MKVRVIIVRCHHKQSENKHKYYYIMASEEIQTLAKEAQAFSQAGEHGKCADTYRRLAELAPTIAEVQLNLGASLSALKDNEGALAAFDKAIELKPKLAAAHANKANALRLLDRNEEALGSYENAVSHDAASGAAWFGLAHVANALEKHEKAVDAADKCLAIGFNSVAAHNERAYALVKLGKAEDALSDVLAIPQDTPSATHLTALVRSEVARLAMEGKDFKKAAEHYKAVCTLEPSFDSKLNCALCLMYLDDLENALALAQEAVSLGKDKWKGHAACGSILTKMRNFEQAAESLQNALNLEDSKDMEVDFSVHYNLGVAYCSLGREAEAQAPLETTIKHCPENWCARALLGIVHINKNDYTSCVQVLNDAIACSPDAENDSSVLYNMGYSKLMLDMPAEALEFFQRAQKLDPSSKQVNEAVAALSSIQGSVGEGKAASAAPPAPPADAETPAAPAEAEVAAPSKLAITVSSEETDASSTPINDTASLLTALDEALNDPVARAKALLKPARPAFMRRPSMERISLGRVSNMRNRFEHLRSLEKQKSEKMIFDRQNNAN